MTVAEIEPFDSGQLTVHDGTQIYWETSGNPKGAPLVWLHGGPGAGLRSGGYRRAPDPEQWLIVGLDQRACGRSRPLATESGFDLSALTTQAMIADLEELRAHLGIERWLVAGGSWGTTLALAYGQAHPDRVTAFLLVLVTSGSRAEIRWITECVGRVFPGTVCLACCPFLVSQQLSRRSGDHRRGRDNRPSAGDPPPRPVGRERPLVTAWELHKRWPASQLVVIDHEGPAAES